MDETQDSPVALSSDGSFEERLRPSKLDDFIGQSRLKENLKVFISAARARSESLDHVLFYGPPGLGKTTLAHIISNEFGSQITVTSGPAVDKAGDLAAILTNVESRSLLFIDEIHRLSPVIEEMLYPAMEDYHIDIIIGQGPSARTVRLEIQKFTLVGATTRAGLLTSPLRDRFGVILRFDFYTPEEISTIIKRSARILNVEVTPEGAMEIARRSRGTPRIANRLLRRVRDYAEVKANGVVTFEVASHALSMLEIDSMGFDKMDRRILLTIIDTFNGGPVGVEAISAALHEERDAIEDLYEPYLIQEGFINRTPRGRIATEKAYIHLKRPYQNADKGTGPQGQAERKEQKKLF